MKSKVVLPVVVVGLLLVGGGVYFLVLRNKTSPLVSPVSQGPVSPQPSAGSKMLVWDDPAGFTFQYDSKLKIDNNPEDKVNYANLEITETGKEGKILVLASDTKFKDVDEWATKDAKLKNSNVIDTTLGGKPAKKVKIAGSDKVVVGAIDDNILFTVETDSAGVTAWQSRADAIISSFEFVYPTTAPQKSSAPSFDPSEEDIIEEEIIE